MARNSWTLQLLAIAVVLVSQNAAPAQLESFDSKEFVFKGGKKPNGVRWSDSLEVGPAGLVPTPSPEKRSVLYWIETDKIPVGLAYRPPQRTEFAVRIKGGDSRRVYLRYGCDGVHWSTWYSTEFKASRTFGKDAYVLDLWLPQAARSAYDKLWGRWATTDRAWADDEDALCRWIAKEQPDFFEHEFPFVGYIQVRVEGFLLGMLNGDPKSGLEQITLEWNWSISGIESPEEPRSKQDSESHWHFEFPQKNLKDKK
jgi:hypothetical protein